MVGSARLLCLNYLHHHHHHPFPLNINKVPFLEQCVGIFGVKTSENWCGGLSQAIVLELPSWNIFPFMHIYVIFLEENLSKRTMLPKADNLPNSLVRRELARWEKMMPMATTPWVSNPTELGETGG